MINKRGIVLIPIFLFLFFDISSAVVAAQKKPVQTQEDSDQTMEGFTLSNFGQNNQKEWDLLGDTLEVFGDLIELTNVTAKVYGDQKMTLTADTGTMNRKEGEVKLRDNVVITSADGVKMTTDTLNWLQNKQYVYTEDKVNIVKDNIAAEGIGADGQTDLKQFNLKNDVKMDIDQKEDNGNTRQITIVCDGPLEIDYLKQIATFNKNVFADDGESKLYADKMTGNFDDKTKQLIEVVCEGNVKIVRGQDTAYSRKAIYNAKTQKISLIGRPKLIFYSSGENTLDFGKKEEGK